MAHRPNFNMTGYDRIYADVTGVLATGDLNFANLEFVVDPDRELSSYPTFNVHPDYVEAAMAAGFQVFSLANNHTTDFGAPGVAATYRTALALQQQSPDTVFSGIRTDAGKDFQLELLELHGWKIGFTAITGMLNDWRGRERVQFTFFDHEREAFLEWLATVRPTVDYLIVSYHDGVEYVTRPHRRKQEYMRRMADAGADIVWGHHPHVLQPMERRVVSRQDGQADALIIYSAGNFISSQTWFLAADDYDLPRAYTGDSAIYRVLLSQHGARPRLESVQTVPITHFITEDYAVVVRRMIPLIDSGQLDEHWQTYYERRLERMRPLLFSPDPLHQLTK
ncbi:CapA family protein [Spirochaeta africana]|nr:CapA family protein [Spirochaeta africana]